MSFLVYWLFKCPLLQKNGSAKPFLFLDAGRRARNRVDCSPRVLTYSNGKKGSEPDVMTPLLDVRDLSIGFGAADPVVRDVSFRVMPGETLALVGESGSGKTITCRSVLRILPEAAQIRGGQIDFNSPNGPPVDLLSINERAMRRIRGDQISMIFQEPMRSLSPLHRLGDQVAEVLKLHREMGPADAKEAVLETFERVGFPDPLRVWKSYPFEMSGGMRQRAMIAMAMVAKPDLLIADEPTTALDVTTQAQVLRSAG